MSGNFGILGAIQKWRNGGQMPSSTSNALNNHFQRGILKGGPAQTIQGTVKSLTPNTNASASQNKIQQLRAQIKPKVNTSQSPAQTNGLTNAIKASANLNTQKVSVNKTASSNYFKAPQRKSQVQNLFNFTFTRAKKP